MKFTLGQAARETGKSKGTISRDIKTGKISADYDEHSKSYQIDAAELFRVYDRVTAEPPENGSTEQVLNDPQPLKTSDGTEGLRAELKFLREKLDLIGSMHGGEVAVLNARIEELRQDREDMRGERNKLLATLQEQAVSVKLLTAQAQPIMPPPSPSSPPSSAPPTQEPGRRGLWSQVFGRRAG